MVDNLSKAKRSKVMGSIHGRNTRPETMVRKILWSTGKRYRIHDRSVYGRPDISNKAKKVAVFIDGCFWHGCETCYKEPTSNVEYWRNKIETNRHRRQSVIKQLHLEGWLVVEFWEHEILSNHETIAERIAMLM